MNYETLLMTKGDLVNLFFRSIERMLKLCKAYGFMHPQLYKKEKLRVAVNRIIV